MPKSKRERLTFDDVAVRKEGIDALFKPPIARSTFYKKIEEGVIVKCRGVDGYYRLNATRVNLGLPPTEVEAYRRRERAREKDISFTLDQRLALVAIAVPVPEIVHLYPLTFFPEFLTSEEESEVMRLVTKLSPEVEALPTTLERIFFAGGLLWASETTEKPVK